jgi:hypothetical protein
MTNQIMIGDNEGNEEIVYHDPEKQEQVITTRKNEIKEIENERDL